MSVAMGETGSPASMGVGSDDRTGGQAISAAGSVWREMGRRRGVLIGGAVLLTLVVMCLGSLPYTLGADASGVARYASGNAQGFLLPPSWAAMDETESARAAEFGAGSLRIFGTDRLGRDLFVRCLTGGGVSIAIGLA
ncbi:MAG TPA: hypothetical protein VG797_08500, partial [Phycisphaerales bacterium]|nr:hypothetical protein [Phycisphaerales bacterium]